MGLLAAVLLAAVPAAGAPAAPPDSHAGARAHSSIISGRPAGQGAFPWMAALFQGDSQICGGSLIAPSIVLTAAHCVTAKDSTALAPENVSGGVLIGRVDLDLSSGERIRVAEISVHPAYEPNRFAFDAALLRLERPSAAPLLRIGDAQLRLAESEKATIVGWGHTRGGDILSSSYVLREATIPLWSGLRCADAWTRRARSEPPDPALMLCAAPASRRTSGARVCNGDSGGPILVRRDGGWRTVGVTSYVYEGCTLRAPPVFTWVASPHVRGWVLRRAAGLAAGSADASAPAMSDLRVTEGIVRYALSEPAETVFAIARRVRGSWRPTGSALVQAGIAGTNSFRFPDRLRGRPVPRGDYRLRALATDESGNLSTAAVLRVRIGRSGR